MAMSAFFAMAALCIAVECMGWRASSQAASDESAHQFPGWPKTFEGDALVEEPQSELERMFAKNFPGRIGRFRAGRRTVILRWTTRPTHRVHGAAYCLQANGWEITARPPGDGDRGALGTGLEASRGTKHETRNTKHWETWSAFRATRGGETLNVREQVRGADGAAFADVPTWFFNALLGRCAGPWWIVTVAD